MHGAAVLAWCLTTAAAPSVAGDIDVLYAALLGPPQEVEAARLLGASGLFVGRAVRTRGRLERAADGASGFRLSAGGRHAVLRLEPLAAATVSARADAWLGQAVEVTGYFSRELRDDADDSYAIRTWAVRGPAEAGARAEADAGPLVSLQDLVYGAGRYDGTVVRVRGTHRGANVHSDLPEQSRKGVHDWILKDGYFAAWVTGRGVAADGGRRDDPLDGTDLAVEVVGVPRTAGGVVRLTARDVHPAPAATAPAIGRAVATGDAGFASVPPHLSFAYPLTADGLGPEGLMVLQFNKPMDPARFAGAVRMRYERGDAPAATPRLALAYRDRYRALVLTPDPPPPPGTTVVVELGEGIVDVDGRALTPLPAPIRIRRGP